MRTRASSLVMAVFLALVFAFAATVRAEWNQSAGGTYAYTTPANWSTGVVDHQFTNGIDGNQTVQFNVDTTLNDFTWARSSTSSAHHSATFQGTGGTHTLTLEGTTRFVPYLNLGLTNQRVQFQNTLNLALAGESPTLVAEFAGSPNSYLYFDGVISGDSGLTTSGSGLIWLRGNNTLSGTLDIQSGQVRLSGAAGSLPNIDTINIAAGGRFELSNYGVNNNRLSDSATINLNGGLGYPQGFETYGNGFWGNFLIGGDNTLADVTETVGTINLESGLSRVAARVYNTGTSYGDTTLTAGSLTRGAGTAVVFAGGIRTGGNHLDLGGALNGGVGAQSYIKFGTAPTLTGGILPYAVVGSDFANNALGGGAHLIYDEFATYDATNGIVPFGRIGAYVTSIDAATSGDNVQVIANNGETWSGDRTMNSLNIRNTFAGTFSGGTITLESGALITRNTYGMTQLGALNFNHQEAFVYHSGGHALQLGGALSNIGPDGINFTAPASHSGGQNDTPFVRFWNIGDNSISAPARVLMGTLLLAGGDPLGASAVTVNQGGTLSLPTSSTRTLGSLTGDGEVRLSLAESGASGSTLVVGGDNTDTTFGGAIHAGQWVYGRLQNGVFTNPGVSGGNLVKTGTGSLTLTGMNTYNGTTTVSQGTLIAGGDAQATSVYGGGLDTLSVIGSFSGSALPGNLANGDRVIVQTRYGSGVSGWTPGQVYYVVNANGTTFQIADTPGGAAKTISNQGNVYWGKLDEAKLVSSAGGDTLTLPTGWNLTAGDQIVFSSLPLNSGLILGATYHVVGVDGGNFQVSNHAGGAPVQNLPSGSFGLVQPTVFGTGTAAIQMGDANTGANPLALLTGGAYTIGRDISVNNFGTGTTLGGSTAEVSNFTGTITLNKVAELTAVAGGTVNFHTTGSGTFTGIGGLTKTGEGTVVLGGANDYTGATHVNQGTLLVNGSIASDATVAAGAFLGGGGMITGNVVVHGTLAPGNSPDQLVVNGDLTFESTSTYEVEIFGPTPGDGVNGYDQTVVLAHGGQNTIAIVDGATLLLAHVGGVRRGDLLAIIDNQDDQPVTGTFAGLADGDEFFVDGWGFRVFYNYSETSFLNDVVLLVTIPEPTSLGLLGLASLALQRRRRK